MTKIEWTQRPGTKGETWNPIRARNKETGGIGHFCVKCSGGCLNCYAADFQKRFKNNVRYAAQDADKVEMFLDETVLMQPLRWKKPRTIFVCSMTDLFYEGHADEWIERIWAMMAVCPQHTFIVLTKRPKPASDLLNAIKQFLDKHPEEDTQNDVPEWPLPNVWLGVSVEDQKAADDRIPVLLDTPAAVRFLSVEPLLGEIKLGSFLWGGRSDCRESVLDHLNWVIVGGESGHNARPMHPDWARTLRDQCKAAGVPFFFKQWGTWMPQIGAKDDFADDEEQSRYIWKEWRPYEQDWEDWPYPQWCDERDPNHCVIKVGKKAAGRSLDGGEHNEWPEVKSC